MIPDYMKEKKQWIVWTSNNKKVPYAPWVKTDPIDPLDESNWTSYQQAVKFVKHRGFDGLGFVFRPEGDIVGIDLDDCVEEVIINDNNVSVRLTDPHQDIVDILDSFTEVSQSGDGIHVYVRGDVGGQVTDHDVDIEIYDQGRFFCMTGNVVTDYSLSVEERNGKIDDLKTAYMGDAEVEQVGQPGSDGVSTGDFDPSEFEPSSDSAFDRLSVDDVFPDLDIPCKTGHPVHGSHTGQNFLVHNEDGFVCTCFRADCSVGDGPGCLLLPQQLLAMKAFDYEVCSEVRKDWCLELRIRTWVYSVEEMGLNPLEIPLSIKAGLGDRYDVDPFAGGRTSVSIDSFLKRKLFEDYGVEWFE